ncbi:MULTISPECIES: hypothetical protein [Lactococcus]|uniref:hypothetical protein n=1 Tax=Lactococcus TaxID=1357 RepID=UPI0038523BC2
MQLKIELFENDMGEALEPGVYQIEIQKGIKKEILYIGESVYPLVRCSEHLYNLKNDPQYFGFTNETIEDSNTSLIFSIIRNERDVIKRKSQEKELIKEKVPLSQSGISDRLSKLRVASLNSWLLN